MQINHNTQNEVREITFRLLFLSFNFWNSVRKHQSPQNHNTNLKYKRKQTLSRLHQFLMQQNNEKRKKNKTFHCNNKKEHSIEEQNLEREASQRRGLRPCHIPRAQRRSHAPCSLRSPSRSAPPSPSPPAWRSPLQRVLRRRSCFFFHFPFFTLRRFCLSFYPFQPEYSDQTNGTFSHTHTPFQLLALQLYI